MAFNQKNVQREGFRKSKFFYNHDVSSTYEFGECQPILCHLCATGQESHHIKMNSIVRMSPLVFPTFGRVVHKVTHHFVPFSQLWQHWENALSDVDTSVTRIDSGNIKEQSYLPTRFPSVQLSVLMQILLRGEFSSYRFCERAGLNVINNSWGTLGSAQTTDVVLCKMFYGDSSTLTNLQFVSLADMEEYIDATDPNTPQHLISDSADFSCMYHDNGLNVDIMLLVKLTTKGKRLFKVLTGLGYVPSFNDHTDVNLLPLFAFYKAYFDAYAIPQYQNFYVSNCYKCIDYINNQGTIEIKGDFGGFGQLANFETYFLDFVNDLSECWYTENSDFVSSCLDAGGYLPSVSNTLPAGLKYPGIGQNGYTVIDATERFDNSLGDQNRNNGLSVSTYDVNFPNHSYYFDQITDDVLKAMYISVQRDSAIGYEIATRLKARGFDTFVSDAKKYFLGTRSQPVQISDVMSTADTTNATLGSYAGKGVGIMYEDSVNFTNSELGYIISISTIYPISKVVNAVNPTHLGLDKFTFYNAQFDGLSYEQVPRNSVGHLTGTSYPAGFSGSRLFGFHPRYTGYKTCASNILNGGFALRSEFQNWLPYTLDRVIIENYHPANNLSGTAANPKFETNDISVGSSYLPSAGLEWRKVANSPWKGNYNRIFSNGQILTEYINYSTWNDKNPPFDNFFVNTEIEHVAFASMLPIEDSWNAVDDEKPHSILSAKQ